MDGSVGVRPSKPRNSCSSVITSTTVSVESIVAAKSEAMWLFGQLRRCCHFRLIDFHLLLDRMN